MTENGSIETQADIPTAILAISPVIRRKVEVSLESLPLQFTTRARTLEELLKHSETMLPKVIFVEGCQYESLLIQARFQQAKIIGFEPREGLLDDPICFLSYVCSQLQQEVSFKSFAEILPKVRNLSPRRLVFLGLSTGGPQALECLLPQLRLRSDTALVVAQHMPPGQTRALAEFISKKKVAFYEGVAGAAIRAGEMYVLPAGLQSYAKVDASGRVTFLTSRFPTKALYAPTIDAALVSFASIYSNQLFAAILTGMGSDGAWGLRLAREWGATTVAEDASTAKVYGMPKVAFQMGGAQTVLRLDEMTQAIEHWQGGGS